MIAPNSIRKKAECTGVTPVRVSRRRRRRTRVPITMRVSPPASRKSGADEGRASARRRTATIETPVSVRIRVSPRTRPFQYEYADSSIRSATRPRSVVCSTFGLWWAGISASIREAVSAPVRCRDWAQASGSSAQ